MIPIGASCALDSREFRATSTRARPSQWLTSSSSLVQQLSKPLQPPAASSIHSPLNAPCHPGDDRCQILLLERSRTVSGTSGRATLRWPSTFSLLSFSRSVHQKCRCSLLAFVLGANAGASQHGVLTDRIGVLSNDFFVNLLDLSNVWSATTDGQDEFEAVAGPPAKSAGPVLTTTVFGSNSQLRAIADVYASSDSGEGSSVTSLQHGQGHEPRSFDLA